VFIYRKLLLDVVRTDSVYFFIFIFFFPFFVRKIEGEAGVVLIQRGNRFGVFFLLTIATYDHFWKFLLCLKFGFFFLLFPHLGEKLFPFQKLGIIFTHRSSGKVWCHNRLLWRFCLATMQNGCNLSSIPKVFYQIKPQKEGNETNFVSTDKFRQLKKCCFGDQQGRI